MDPQFRMLCWPWAFGPSWTWRDFQTAAGGSAASAVDPKFSAPNSKQEIHRNSVKSQGPHKKGHILTHQIIAVETGRPGPDVAIKLAISWQFYESNPNLEQFKYTVPSCPCILHLPNTTSYGGQHADAVPREGMQLIHECRSAMWIRPPEVCQVPLPCSFGILSARRFQKENLAIQSFDRVTPYNIPDPFLLAPHPKMAKVLP